MKVILGIAVLAMTVALLLSNHSPPTSLAPPQSTAIIKSVPGSGESPGEHLSKLKKKREDIALLAGLTMEKYKAVLREEGDAGLSDVTEKRIAELMQEINAIDAMIAQAEADRKPADGRPKLTPEQMEQALRAKTYDEGIIVAVQTILSASSLDVRAEAYCRFTVEQTQTLTARGDSRSNDAVGEYARSGSIDSCKAGILTGYQGMPNDSFFMNKLSKAQQDLKELNAKLPQYPLADAASVASSNVEVTPTAVVISKVEPEYSQEARKAKFSGDIRVAVEINATGRVATTF